MQSAQESKQELEAAIRYAENAISSAKQTIESMKFRQEMAQKQFSEQTGREQTLQAQVKLLEERIADMTSDMVGDASTIKELRDTIDRMGDDITGDSVTIKQLNDERDMLEKNVKYLRDENERLKREKEASSGPCGCQAYRDLEEKVGDLESEVNALEQPERDKARLDRVCAPTNPVIPKDVAIAIFREGVQHGVEATCTELDNAADINIEENEYCGDFEVSFSKYIDLSDHLDTDWMRGKCGDYSEESVIDALGTLCADDEVKFTIEGLEDEKPNAD